MTKDGYLVGFDQKSNSITVREWRWTITPYEEKVLLAKTVLCAVVRPHPATEAFDIRSDLTNHVIAEWRGGELTVK